MLFSYIGWDMSILSNRVRLNDAQGSESMTKG